MKTALSHLASLPPPRPLPVPRPLPLSLEVSQRAFDGARVHRLSIRLTSAASQNGCFLPAVLKADSAARPLYEDNIVPSALDKEFECFVELKVRLTRSEDMNTKACRHADRRQTDNRKVTRTFGFATTKIENGEYYDIIFEGQGVNKRSLCIGGHQLIFP